VVDLDGVKRAILEMLRRWDCLGLPPGRRSLRSQRDHCLCFDDSIKQQNPQGVPNFSKDRRGAHVERSVWA
jgi:hypothetical protein